MTAKFSLYPVYFALVFETAQTILLGVNFWITFADGFGDLLVLRALHFGPIHTSLMGSVMALVVHLFFCYRIWIISRPSIWFCIFIGCVRSGIRFPAAILISYYPIQMSTVQAVAGCAGGIRVPFLHKHSY